MVLNTCIDGRYQLLHQIGKGGFSKVYLADDLRLNEKRALKIGTGESPCCFLKKEGQLMAKLKHPHLPHIYDLIHENNRTILVMDYIEGMTLEAYLEKNGPLSQAESMMLMQQLCCVFTYLHNQQPNPLIHRDLKPKNILITNDLKLYLLDFGSSRTFSIDKLSDTAYLGTVGYAPPELLQGAQTDERSDIYSLGVTFYQMLSGCLDTQLLFGTDAKPPCTSEVFEIVQKSTKFHPFERYQSVAELSEALANCQSNGQVEEKNAIHRKKTPLKRLSLPLLVITAMLIGYLLPIGIQWADSQVKTPITIASDLSPKVAALIDKTITLRAFNDQYMSLKPKQENALYANLNTAGVNEQFLLEEASPGLVSLKAANGNYLGTSHLGKGFLFARSNTVGQSESFQMQYLGTKEGKVFFCLRALSGYYWTSDISDNGLMTLRAQKLGGGWETFYVDVVE